jgi:hypothetical protein
MGPGFKRGAELATAPARAQGQPSDLLTWHLLSRTGTHLGLFVLLLSLLSLGCCCLSLELLFIPVDPYP